MYFRIKKEFTTQDVLDSIKDDVFSQSVRWKDDGDLGPGYYYRVPVTENGQIWNGSNGWGIEKVFECKLDEEAHGENNRDYDYDYFVENIETEENIYFMEVLEDLADQVNIYLQVLETL